jgi:Calx-beta domain
VIVSAAAAAALLLVPGAAGAAKPKLSVADVAVAEGSAGNHNASFKVSLSRAAPATVRVKYHTEDGTAVAPGDYTATSGTLRIPKGKKQKKVTVPVVADTVGELDETFDLVLTNPKGATIKDGRATATLTDDDPAGLILNEVAPNITNNADLVELATVSGGNVGGMTVTQGPASTTLATLPELLVPPGDFIVVHLNPPSAVTTETSSKTQCTSAACYSGAWDVAGGTTGVTFSHRVLAVRTPSTSIQDAVPFITTSVMGVAGFPAEVQAIQALGQWSPANCGGALCGYSTMPTVADISADWTTASSPTGSSTIRRTGASDTNSDADWTVGAQSIGASNP